MEWRKQDVFTLSPKNRNREVCKRRKITRPPCRKRTSNQEPRAKKSGHLITANHKILSEDCESRNNHRFAVVVQELASRWFQSYPCRMKKLQETERSFRKFPCQETEKSLRKFLEPSADPKVMFTVKSLEFGKVFQDLFWNHCTSPTHRSETNGIAERAVRRVKQGTSSILLQLSVDENGGLIPWNTAICETFKTSSRTGQQLKNGVSELNSVGH